MTHEILVKKVLRKKEEIWRPPVMRDPTERQSMIQMALWERKILLQIWQLPWLKGKMTKEKRNPLTIISSSNKRCCNSGKIQLASQTQKSPTVWRRDPVRVEDEDYQFLEPCPTSMMHLNLTELAASDISWKMMTAFRPEQIKDENVFSRSGRRLWISPIFCIYEVLL